VEVSAPNLDYWLPTPAMRVAHRRESSASPDQLWRAAEATTIGDTALLGRLVRWRVPGTRSEQRFDELFRGPPFMVLEEDAGTLVSGIVGRIWTLRRDYPQLGNPEEFRDWSERGTARVVFASWVAPERVGRAALNSEVRVETFGAQGRFGLRAVRPLIGAFQNLIGSDGIEAAIRRAERGR
jgi:hypothetical protein